MIFSDPANIRSELNNLNNELKKPKEHERFHVYNDTISNHNSTESRPESEESDLSKSATPIVSVYILIILFVFYQITIVGNRAKIRHFRKNQNHVAGRKNASSKNSNMHRTVFVFGREEQQKWEPFLFEQ